SGRSPLRPARRRRPTAPDSASSPRAHARSSRCLPLGTSNHPPPLCRPSLNPPSAPSVPTPPLLPLLSYHISNVPAFSTIDISPGYHAGEKRSEEHTSELQS